MEVKEIENMYNNIRDLELRLSDLELLVNSIESVLLEILRRDK